MKIFLYKYFIYSRWFMRRFYCDAEINWRNFKYLQFLCKKNWVFFIIIF